MGPLSYMQSDVDRNVFMRRVPVTASFYTGSERTGSLNTKILYSSDKARGARSWPLGLTYRRQETEHNFTAVRLSAQYEGHA